MQVMLRSMKRPVYVRPVTDAERAQLATGLRSSEAFVLRCSQILLASARGESAPHIARQLGCDDQTVRNANAAFNTRGLAPNAWIPQTRGPGHAPGAGGSEGSRVAGGARLGAA